MDNPKDLPVAFDEASVKRIIQSVLDSERRRKNRTNLPRPNSRRVSPEFDILEATLNAYDASNKIGTLTGVRTSLPTGARNTDDVNYVFNKYNLSLTGIEQVICIYEFGAFDDTEGDNIYGRVDWTILPFQSGNDLVWNCQLYNNSKTFANPSAQVKLLKADGTPHGEGITAYDPHHQFSSGGSENSLGRVMLVKDFETGANRLEFTHLEGPALLVCVNIGEHLGTGTGGGNGVVNSYKGVGWWRNNPGERVNVVTCGSGPQEGDNILAFLSDPDTVPLTYHTLELPQGTGGTYTKYGIVTKAMTQAVHTGEGMGYEIDPDSSLGECLLLDEWWAPSNEWKLVVDPEGTGTDPTASTVLFKNISKFVPIKVGKVVQLTCDTPIFPGMEAGIDQKIPVGRYNDIVDYLEALPNHIPGTAQILWHPADGGPQWGGETCGT